MKLIRIPVALALVLAGSAAAQSLPSGFSDQVILGAYDFPGNFRAVEFVGARPVLIDIDPDTWCITPEGLAETARQLLV